MGEAATKQKRSKLPAGAKWAIGYAGVPVVSAGLAYFWRVVFEQGDRLPQLPLTLGILAVGSILYLCVFLLQRFCRGNLCLKAALCVLVLGLLFCFANPPLQAPDESAHFRRAYAIAHGQLNYDYARQYPDDVGLLMEAFPSQYNHKVTYGGYRLPISAFGEYRQALEAGRPPAEAATEPIMPLLLPYLPAALGMLAARLFGFSALGLLYAGRMANLLVYAFICYLTFKNCHKYRGVFMAVALLPLALFMGASCSYDSIMLALCLYAVSFFCKNEIFTRDVVFFGLAILGATYLKPVNVVLAAVLLLVPKARWRTRWNPWLAAGGVVAVGLAFWFVASNIDGGLLTINLTNDLPRADGANVSAQIAFVLRGPLRFISTALLTLVENGFFLTKGLVMTGLGVFGWTDLFIPLAGLVSLLSLAASSALGIQQKDDTKATGAVALALAAVCYAGAVMLGIYVAESPVGSIRITGLQTRYFLPAFLLLFMLASILLGKAVRPRLKLGETTARTESLTLWIAAGAALVSAVLLFQANFIGQWIPKTEGYKLVNLFGWVQ